MTEPAILTSALHSHIDKAIAQAGGWIGFDRFMALALYTPGLGYYANDTAKFGALPDSGSDFVTAPEISPVFGQLVAAQMAEAMERTGTREIWEFGAGTGALALQILDELQRLGVGATPSSICPARCARASRSAWHPMPPRWSGPVLCPSTCRA